VRFGATLSAVSALSAVPAVPAVPALSAVSAQLLPAAVRSPLRTHSAGGSTRWQQLFELLPKFQ